MKRIIRAFPLAAILFSGFLLRFWGIGWGLPYLVHPDEFQVVQVYLRMVKDHSLSPHFFGYPGFPIYINGFFYGLYYTFQRLTGHFHSSADIAFPQIIIMGTGIISDPNVYYLGRFLSLLFGVGTIYISYRCAKDISNKDYVGLLAAAFTAVSNANIVQSRLILPNIYVAFFTILAVWLAVRLLKTGRTIDYLLAGLAVGLTASSKYNGAVVVLAVVTAHFLRTGFRGWKDKRIFASFIAAGLVFVIANLYAIFDYKLFIVHFLVVSNTYVSGWPGAGDIPVVWYGLYLLRMEGVAAVAALGGIFWAFWKKQPAMIVAGVFPLVNFALLCLMKNYNEHTLLPLLPVIHVLGACFLGILIERGLVRFTSQKRLTWAAAAILLFFSLALPLLQTVRTNRSALQINSQTTARIWIEQNIPAGSSIALESYSPYVDPEKYQVVPVVGFVPRGLQWYQERHIQFLVFSQGMYGRYYANPGRYKGEISIYEALFKLLEPVKIFNDGGYEIRVYKLRTP